MEQKYSKYILDEYKKQGKEPVKLNLGGGKSLVVPASYNGDIDAFVDDLFSFQDCEPEKYDRHNKRERNKDNPIICREIDLDILQKQNIHLVVPFKYAQKKMSDSAIFAKVYEQAVKRYKDAIIKTARLNKEYPEAQAKVSLSRKHFNECTKKHLVYTTRKICKAVGKALKWTTKQATNAAIGTITSPFALGYTILDKKHRISIDPKKKKWIDNKALPYIKKGLYKGMIIAASYGGIKLMENGGKLSIGDKNIISQIVDNNENEALSKKYKITDEQSFQQLYDAAFPLIIKSMLPTEVLINEGYSDNGKKISNTIGIGSYWYPENGNPKSSKWILTKNYLQKHPNFTITGQQASAVADGWFRYRENGRVYKNMCDLLQGAELNICEFAAIATCMYNDESNGRDLCRFVKENYQNPVECANYLMNLKPGNSSFNDGILKRHTHEALLYLNHDNYADKMGMFLVKEGINSKGNKYYVTSVTQLSVDQCKIMQTSIDNGSLTGASQTAQCIYNYVCKGGKTVDQIAKENGIDIYCSDRTLNFAAVETRHTADSMYNAALAAYNNKDYSKARDGFQAMIDAGYNGADIHNDLAITYYHLKEYDKCIAECQEILNTGETEQYAPANYNAGRAYEAKGNLSRAKQNYERAAQREPEREAYSKAVNRVTNLMNNANTRTR